MTKTPYPLSLPEANCIVNGVDRSISRMIAAMDLLELPLCLHSFDDKLEWILGKRNWAPEPTKEEQEENAYRWLITHYEVIRAAFTAVAELVRDTRDDLDKIEKWRIAEHFYTIGKEEAE